MKILLVQAQVDHLSDSVRDNIKNALEEGLANGILVYDKSFDISVVEIDDLQCR
ncbi:hypothetical protein ACSHMG_17540 [Bacillus [licheniformis] CMCC 63516]|uniref:hypothetical protein n=1 Tax=Bacillus TaxID=1386 RepID=UPI00137506A9|nr:hypothetical protein [Bacillus paralicheniformis]WOH90883.1 hypothetical protein RZN08_20415 [Bacillus paralicheniformis]